MHVNYIQKGYIKMGHYDECREGYCPSCGAAPGNIFGGLCEFCDKPKIKLTDWFDPLITPYHIGVYEVKYFEEATFSAYSYWNGLNWSWLTSSPKEALKQHVLGNTMYDKIHWRGILK